MKSNLLIGIRSWVVALAGVLVILGLPLGIPLGLVFLVFRDVYVENAVLRILLVLPVAGAGFVMGTWLVIKLFQFQEWLEIKRSVASDEDIGT